MAGGLLLAGAAAGVPPLARADDAASAATGIEGLVPYSNPSQGYSLLRPADWEQVRRSVLAAAQLHSWSTLCPAG